MKEVHKMDYYTTDHLDFFTRSKLKCERLLDQAAAQSISYEALCRTAGARLAPHQLDALISLFSAIAAHKRLSQGA